MRKIPDHQVSGGAGVRKPGNDGNSTHPPNEKNKTMTSDDECKAFFFFGFTLALVTTSWFLLWFTDRTWHRNTIERGFAEYDQATGAWQWKSNMVGMTGFAEYNPDTGKWQWKDGNQIKQ